MPVNRETVKIAQNSIVCSEHTKMDGDITIGLRNVIHPTATIIAEAGPIVIGDYNLIEENVCIINKSPKTMTIGSHNVFEVGARSETTSIGDDNVFESKCRVGNLTKITNCCIIGAMCDINYDEILKENTIIFGSNCNRRLQHEKPSPPISQIDFLTKILPNYQTIERPNYRISTNLQSPTS